MSKAPANPHAEFVAGDWGTSRLRLFLCAADGAVLQSVEGPGAAAVPGAHAATLEALIDPWRRDRGPLPVILCGMVGSNLGWVEAPYVSCPARPEQIAGACIGQWNGHARIIPGLSCRNRFDAPDLMRGEETQILGALCLEPTLQSGTWLLCLPGTHTKWVLLEGGEVREFLTAPSGELFAILREHSVLIGREEPTGDIADTIAFIDGLRAFNAYPDAQLLHRLFECRSRRLSGELDPPAATAFLSGLLTASDVCGALSTFSTAAVNAEIVLIGAPPLTALYHAALRERGYRSRRMDGAAASLAGLVHVHRQLGSRSNAHAG